MSKRKLKPYFPASDEFDIELFPFYWVARLNAKYALEMEKTLKLLNMDVSRWRVAVLLHRHEELSISEIAEHAIGKMPTITKIVYRMRDEELVEIGSCLKDRRVIRVRLTHKGQDIVDMVLQQTQTLFRKAFKGMSDAQIRKSTELLSQLFSNLNQ